ncbi:IS1096 element passenger TnpR family protein [Nonomuraea africana]|uniref:IS1096 element passenger TnpR family protein n=1 Tax=Nonomuraea africana TaxID=46171 RepID=UPI0033E9CA17
MGTIHQLKITLRGVHPPVWRRVHVPSTATLDQLHEVIQVAMGWEQQHLHVFGKGDLEYGDNARDETMVTLAAVIPRVGDRLGYRYDFGDFWDHDIEVEKVHRAAKNTTYPRSVRMHATGDYTIAELMEVFSVGRATVYRVLERTPVSPTTKAEDAAPAP